MCVSVCLHVCLSVRPKNFLVEPIVHWTMWVWPSIMVSTVSWDDEVAHKTRWFDLDLFLIFSLSHENWEFCAHCTMNRGHFVDTITHWTVSVLPSIMVSTVSWDDEVAHETRCFDLDLFLTFSQRGSLCEHHWTVWLHLQSWFQQLVGMMKLCTRPIALMLTFLWYF